MHEWQLQHRDIAAYIKEHTKWSLQRSRDSKDDTEVHFMNFCADMMQLCLKTKLNLYHITDILATLGNLTFTAKQHQKKGLSPTTQQLLYTLMELLCKQLWTQRSQLSANHSAMVLTALSQTDIRPDTFPGLTDTLAEQFMADSECHNAYRYIQALYGCAQMEINPCNGQLREHILQRFPKLSLAQIKARMLANMLFAVAERPWPSVLSGSAEAAAADIDTKAAHKVCTRLTRVLSSSEMADQCSEDDMASSLSSLRILRHRPKDEFVPIFVSRYTQLLRQMQNQTDPQASQRILIILTACVALQLQLPASMISTLMPHILGTKSKRHPRQSKAAARARAAWAFAALGILDFQTLDSLLCTEGKNALPWSPEDLIQLYQAVDYLQPEATGHHPDNQRWQALYDQVAALGSRPVSDATPAPAGLSALHAVLDQSLIKYSSHVQLGSFMAPVVVQPQEGVDATLVFDFIAAEDCFANAADRCAPDCLALYVCRASYLSSSPLIHLYVCLSVRPSVHPSLRPSICWLTCPPVSACWPALLRVRCSNCLP